ncbi:RIKEN cDNA 6330500D04, isoform CRA_f, partial [Mus musculus]
QIVSLKKGNVFCNSQNDLLFSGLAGFARLCPGDQYEIFMKYGRQRWKLKGKIEVNGKQSWDGAETVFLPLIVGFISIKVQ